MLHNKKLYGTLYEKKNVYKYVSAFRPKKIFRNESHEIVIYKFY